jgi:hypothetical protein
MRLSLWGEKERGKVAKGKQRLDVKLGNPLSMILPIVWLPWIGRLSTGKWACKSTPDLALFPGALS